MSTGDKARNKAEELKGGTKETLGRETGDREMQREGKAEKSTASLKQAAEKVKDAFRK